MILPYCIHWIWTVTFISHEWWYCIGNMNFSRFETYKLDKRHFPLSAYTWLAVKGKTRFRVRIYLFSVLPQRCQSTTKATLRKINKTGGIMLHFQVTVEPWAMRRLGAPTLPSLENLNVILQLALPIFGSTSEHSTNLRSCTTVVYTIEKNPHKSGPEEFTLVIQGSAVYYEATVIKVKPVNPKGNQSWIFIGRTDTEAKAPILWLPHPKNWLSGKDPDVGKGWR